MSSAPTPTPAIQVAPQPRLAVRMAAYPMIRLTEGMNLPNDADCCVICLDNFKVLPNHNPEANGLEASSGSNSNFLTLTRTLTVP